MSEVFAGLVALASLSLAAACLWFVNRSLRESAEAEARRVADWWERSQRHIDNLQDRVSCKEFETYAQASHVARPADQPVFTAEGEFNAGEMARDLLEKIRNEQDSGLYADEDFPDVAYDGPTLG